MKMEQLLCLQLTKNERQFVCVKQRAHVEGGFACTENSCKCSFRTELGLIRHVRGIHGKKSISTKENVSSLSQMIII